MGLLLAQVRWRLNFIIANSLIHAITLYYNTFLTVKDKLATLMGGFFVVQRNVILVNKKPHIEMQGL